MITRLKPETKSYLWGGTKLKEKYGKQCDKDTLAETWELSCHPDGPSIIIDGPYAGQSLAQVVQSNKGRMLGKKIDLNREFPLLVKLIDARLPLSIQVHPDDIYALEHEHQYGKTEMWYIVDCEDDSYIYYGFKDKISKEEFAKRIEKNTLTEVLNAVKVHPGDTFMIEAGMVHAIGAGILIAEIQENSNVTYRVYDYGRKDMEGHERPLHIEKAEAVAKLNRPNKEKDTCEFPVKCEYFEVDKQEIKGSKRIQMDGSSFKSILLLDGKICLEDEKQTTWLQHGDCAFISADTARCHLFGQGICLEIGV